ncbi:MAG: hypothetical protein HRF49_07525 [bacterium]|jgi:hypothetical protein
MNHAHIPLSACFKRAWERDAEIDDRRIRVLMERRHRSGQFDQERLLYLTGNKRGESLGNKWARKFYARLMRERDPLVKLIDFFWRNK